MKPNKIMRKSISEWKARQEQKKCSACGGSGHYDAKGSPKCSACNGTGKETK